MPAALKQPQTEKRCSSCKQIMSVAFFYRHKNGSHLYKSQCKSCSNISAAKRRKNKPLSSEQRRNNHLKYSFGMTWDDYQSMMQDQKGCCAICKQPFEMDTGVHGRVGNNKPCVDHCHETNRVRGILCGQCNRGLGFFRDNSEFMANAIKYLKGKTYGHN